MGISIEQVTSSLENAEAVKVPLVCVPVQTGKPFGTKKSEEAFTDKQWEETPHLPKGLNVDSTDSKAEDNPEVIDDSGELGVAELSLWKKFQASGMTSPTFGMKSLGGEYENVYAFIRVEGDKKTFVVSAQSKLGTLETVELDFFHLLTSSSTRFNIARCAKGSPIINTLGKAGKFNYLVDNGKTVVDFLTVLWGAWKSLPVRNTKVDIRLPEVLDGILWHISASKESYYYKEAGHIWLRSVDLYSIAEELEVQPSKIVQVLNDAGLLVHSGRTGTHQLKKRINNALCNVYVIRI